MSFGRYAGFYDAFYSDKGWSKEVSYVDGLISKFRPGAKSLLDMGCGTGRHDFLFDTLGYEVTGFDCSLEMVQVARRKNECLGKGVEFVTGDVRYADLGKEFDAVVSLFHVISYQSGDEEVLSAFRTANRHLRMGGVFVFDVWWGPAVQSQGVEERVKEVDIDCGRLLVKRVARPVLRDGNLVDVNYTFSVYDSEKCDHDVFDEKHTMRYFFRREIYEFARKSGFEVIRCEEWLTGKSLSNKTWGACFVLKKIRKDLAGE